MKNDNIIISKTPLRVSFVGGGTDMPYFYKKNIGNTISCAIDKYIYVTVKYHNNYNEKYRLNYSQTESVNKINDIKNYRIKNVLKYLNINKPIYINTFADIPAQNGLGSSSAFTVGLINALSRLKKIKYNRKQIAELAFKIESKITNNSIGKQDHYIASFGGFRHITYSSKEIKIKKLDQSKKILNYISNSVLVWSNTTRLAEKVLKDQKNNKNKNVHNLKKLNMLTYKFLSQLKKTQQDNIKLFKIIKESWIIKKKLSKQITNRKIEKLFHNLEKNNIYPGKILGAGNGGFILTYLNKPIKSRSLKYLKKYKYFKFNIENNGSEIIS
tara:strand:+ start:4095 stop:5078 length:984 start_codon:yes stop_codon:yes gene_type:complete